jgi:lysophospholipid acyltransferase (LPLAT)-like uncharacterized protein
MKNKIISLLASVLLRLIALTCRYKLNFENKSDQEIIKSRQFLLAFFHQNEIALIPYFKHKNIGVLVSMSKDGEIMKNIAQYFGYYTIRGSSSRGAVKGLISAIRAVKSGYSFSMAVDGPRGPIHKVKDGICAIHKKTGIPIIPVGVDYSKAKIFEKSWSKARLPYFFSKITLNIGTAKSYNKEELEAKLLELNQ